MPRAPSTVFRPMLAAPTTEAELRAIRFPKLISAKIDGVRAMCRANPQTGEPELVSRKLIKIPNAHAQYLFARSEYIGLDGELAVGDPTDKNLMQRTTSGVMTEAGEPNLTWFVFDTFSRQEEYIRRAGWAKLACGLTAKSNCVRWLPQFPVRSYEEMCVLEESFIEQGYEGAIIRDPRGMYKYGRSTLRQEWMLKIKRFQDGEAEVIGTVELKRNENEATVDETGYAKRSSHASGKVLAGTLGALQVRDIKSRIEFEIGTGFTAEQRANLWKGKQFLIGKLVKYKHFPIGVKDKPRHPIFVAFRDKRDI